MDSFGLEKFNKSHQAGGWTFESNRSHILNSKCTSSFICNKTHILLEQQNSTLMKNNFGTPRKTFDEFFEYKQKYLYEKNLCLFCKYNRILSMAHFPDMTYPSNYLKLKHAETGLILEFIALDALAPVIIKSYGLPTGLKVSAAEAWLKARMNCEYTKNVCNADFDWTFSSDYSGSYRFDKEQVDLREDRSPLKNMIEPTNDRIDMEKLKIRKQIHFFDEIELFEDELADHGVAQYSVKIRVHDDSFYILCRYFLRVDQVFVRYFDTRIYHEFGQDYLLREQSNHESNIVDLELPNDSAQALLINPQNLFQYVPIKHLKTDKIRFKIS